VIKVKICGINSADAFDAAYAAGADWIGFVFFPPSPRAVTPARARELSLRKRGGPLRVGLFVAPDEALIATTLAEVALDILQLYRVDLARAAAIRRRFGRAVWWAAEVATAEDLPFAADGIDAIVLDAKASPEATRPGGNAQSFSWSLLQGWNPPLPWILAGGLTPANVGMAIATSGAKAVDVSSGVERAPGVKDPALIAAFITAAREADRHEKGNIRD
jgi:phosphoribosylanthranilate isomerase